MRPWLGAGALVLIVAMTPGRPGAGPAAASGRRIALTFDDLPYVGVVPLHGGRAGELAAARAVTGSLVGTLARERVPAYGFVNESRLEVAGEEAARADLLRQWLDAGVPLGNHTRSHLDINRVTLDEYTADIVRGETVTKRLVEERGGRLEFFRHPYTHTGPTQEKKDALDRFLRERGYRVAPFTVEHADYIFNAAWLVARRDGDADLAGRIRRAYLEHLGRALDYFERRAVDIVGRDITHILLTHANDLNADCLGEVLDRLRGRGYRFVPMEEALKDPAYDLPDGYIGESGPSWIHRWGAAKGIAPDFSHEPDPPSFVLQIYNKMLQERARPTP